MASSERMTHASRLRVLVAWTGGTAWEYGRVADHLVDEVQMAACGADAPVGEMILAAHHRGLPTCPTCAVLIDEAAQMHVPPICDFCIEPFAPNTYDVGKAGPQHEAPQRCFDCSFWLSRADEVEAGRGKWIPFARAHYPPIIVEGVFYAVGDPPQERPPSPRSCSGLGFGGARWDVKWNDGRTVTTHNLWHGGAIPEYYRMRLPQLRDNATFMKPKPVATTAVAARVTRRRR